MIFISLSVRQGIKILRAPVAGGDLPGAECGGQPVGRLGQHVRPQQLETRQEGEEDRPNRRLVDCL